MRKQAIQILGEEQSKHRKHYMQTCEVRVSLSNTSNAKKTSMAGAEGQGRGQQEWRSQRERARPHAVSAITTGLFAEKENKISRITFMGMPPFRR